MADHDAGESTTEEEWRFPLSDFEEDGDADANGDDGAVDATAREDATVVDASEGNARIEPGEPSLEGVVFVLLGVAFALFVVSRLFVA